MADGPPLSLAEDILSDALSLIVPDAPSSHDASLRYGPLVLHTASKDGKANILLADQFFSPSLLLAEYIERGLIPLKNTTVLELGAGSALPCLLSSTLQNHPALVIVTDYPDDTIMANLRRNVQENLLSVVNGCSVDFCPYIWGSDTDRVLAPLSKIGRSDGYDVVILSDLLYFDASHKDLVRSLTALLARRPSSQAYIAAGKYTSEKTCDTFFALARDAGFVFEEETVDGGWKGCLPIEGISQEGLTARKNNVRLWVLRWDPSIVLS